MVTSQKPHKHQIDNKIIYLREKIRQPLGSSHSRNRRILRAQTLILRILRAKNWQKKEDHVKNGHHRLNWLKWVESSSKPWLQTARPPETREFCHPPMGTTLRFMKAVVLLQTITRIPINNKLLILSLLQWSDLIIRIHNMGRINGIDKIRSTKIIINQLKLIYLQRSQRRRIIMKLCSVTKIQSKMRKVNATNNSCPQPKEKS